MKAELSGIETGGWSCKACQKPLEILPVAIIYIGSRFEVSLPRCPQCGHTLIPVELALGKMLEVEKILEDK